MRAAVGAMISEEGVRLLRTIRCVLSGREADVRVSEHKRAALAARLALSNVRRQCGYGTLAVETLTWGPTIAIARPGAAFTFATSENVC